VLPIAILEAPCRFRDAALAALDREGRAYRVALETPSLSALRAAVQAGLAVTCRTALFLPGSPPLEEVGLPELPQVAYVRRTNDSPHASIAKLSQLVHAAAVEL
jgi:DNA-binding transcriptional LysR family regulator